MGKIFELTGCIKPCSYKRYSFLGEKQVSSFVSEDFYFALMPMSNDTFVETEVLVYPWTSLVAEFGGTLGLFLGISALDIWNFTQKFLGGLSFLHPKKDIVSELKCPKYSKG